MAKTRTRQTKKTRNHKIPRSLGIGKNEEIGKGKKGMEDKEKKEKGINHK